jgi:hypothetical protein
LKELRKRRKDEILGRKECRRRIRMIALKIERTVNGKRLKSLKHFEGGKNFPLVVGL